MSTLTHQLSNPLTNFTVAETIATQNRRLRVLHLINGEFYAGAERVQDLLAQNLPAMGCDVGFACVKADQFINQRQCQNIPLEEVPVKHPWHIASTKKLVKILRDGNYDIAHSHTPRSLWAGSRAASRVGCPLIHTMHDVSLGESTDPARWAVNSITLARLRSADFVTTVSASTELLAEKLQLGKKRRRIFNGVPAARPDFQRTPPLRDQTWNLGTAALIRPCKGIEVLIHAVAELRKRNCPVRCTIAGGFNTEAYRQQILKLVHDLNVSQWIEFIGFQNDVSAALEDFDLFVIPSIGPEGLPMALLESMAHGLPTIGSDVPGIADVLEDGIDGLLFPPGDFNSLADKVELFIQGKIHYSSMSSQARHRHANHFSDAKMASQFARIYRELVPA